jgi:filamentous hemagglutinin
LPPHDDEPNKGNKDSYSGGPHKDTSKPTRDGLDSHHCLAKSCYKDVPISSEDGPAIKMDPEDHQKTSSYGNSDSAKNYILKQKKLIDEGKFLDSFQMEIDDIKNV